MVPTGVRYQSHHTGIEIWLLNEISPDINSTNRTTLELKLKYNIVSTVFRTTTNRTTLELKCPREAKRSLNSSLPIAPHWN